MGSSGLSAYRFGIFGQPAAGRFFAKALSTASVQLPSILRISGLGPGLALGTDIFEVFATFLAMSALYRMINALKSILTEDIVDQMRWRWKWKTHRVWNSATPQVLYGFKPRSPQIQITDADQN